MAGRFPLTRSKASRLRSLALAGVAGAAAFLTGAASPAAATLALTPCVLSQTEVLQRSQPAATAGIELQQARQRAQAAYNLASRDIESDARMLESLRTSLPAKVLQSRSQDIADRRAALQRKTDEINHGLVQLNTSLGTAVMQQASTIIHDIAVSRSCGVVLPRETLIQIIDPSLDITPAVIDRLGVAK